MTEGIISWIFYRKLILIVESLSPVESWFILKRLLWIRAFVAFQSEGLTFFLLLTHINIQVGQSNLLLNKYI